MGETKELAEKLAHRDNINKGKAEPKIKLTRNYSGVYPEFEEFSRKQIKEYERIFKEYDTSMNGYLEQSELQVSYSFYNYYCMNVLVLFFQSFSIYFNAC